MRAKHFILVATVVLAGLMATSTALATAISVDSGQIYVGSNMTVTNADVVAAFGGNPIDSANNLLQNHLAATPTYSGTMMYSSVLANINDGLMVSNGGYVSYTPNSAVFSSGAGESLVFTLDAAYDLEKIAVYTAFGNKRLGQAYSIDVSTDDGATWSSLISVAIANGTTHTVCYARGVTITDDTTGTLAAGVNALRFNFTIPASGEGIAVYSEIAVYGAVVPEPSALALLATGLIGLLCYAWRKRK